MLVRAMRRAPAEPEPADVPAEEPFQVPDSFWTDEGAVGGAIPSGTPSGVPLRGNGLPLSYSYSYDAYPQPPLPSPPPPPHAPPPPPPTQITLCANGCPAKPKYANDNYCDDGGPDSLFDNCELGTDCADCGPRVRYARVPLSPRPPPPPAPPPPVRFVGTSRASATNPFVGGAAFYHRTAYRRLVGAVLEDDTVPQSARAALLGAWRAPTAFWVDASERVGPAADGTETAASVLADAAAQGGETPPLVVFVLHALPNRGCDDDAPASPVCCVYRTDGGCDFAAAGDCEVGLAEYLDGYVEPLASLLAANARVPAVVVLEPAALPALAAAAPGCAAPSTRAAHLGGLGAAIDRLSTRAPHAALYLGAGDGPRLGYGALARRLAVDASRLGLGRTRSVRGFATNIGSYQPVGAACKLDDDGSLARWCRERAHEDCCTDGCHLVSAYNSGNNALNYAQLVAHHAQVAMPGFTPHFVIDTGRARVGSGLGGCEARPCNVRGAGLGRLPTAATGHALVDAFFWVKPPGESDGCGTCKRPEANCGAHEAFGTRDGEAHSPAAGDWYAAHLAQLALSTLHVLAGPELRAAEREYLAATGRFAVAAAAAPLPAAAEEPTDDVDGSNAGKVAVLVVACTVILVVVLAAVWRAVRRAQGSIVSRQLRSRWAKIGAAGGGGTLLGAGATMAPVGEEHGVAADLEEEDGGDSASCVSVRGLQSAPSTFEVVD